MRKVKTLSKFIYYNCKNIVCQDSSGNVITGSKLDSEAYLHNEVLVVRFRNGYLDGDIFDDDGVLLMTLPAIEGRNHKEYWRRNRLHRDGGMPAVISGEPAQTEYWINGIRQSETADCDYDDEVLEGVAVTTSPTMFFSRKY